MPNLRSVATLTNPANPAHPLSVKELRAAADTLGLQVQIFEIRHSDEYEGAFASMARGRRSRRGRARHSLGSARSADC